MTALLLSFLLSGAFGPAVPSPEIPATPTATPTPTVFPSPAPFGSCATPITKANVDALIDSEIPDWMRKEAAVLILNMVAQTGCFRGEIASEDKDGRFITNSIAALRSYQQETAGVWHRLNSLAWVSPSGDAVPMQDSPTPKALLGHWTCTNEYGGGRESYYFGPNHRGRSFSGRRIEDFIYQYDVPRHDLYVGYGHGQGMAHRVTLGNRTMAMIVWGYYHERRWTPMPTQPLLTCGKTAAGLTSVRRRREESEFRARRGNRCDPRPFDRSRVAIRRCRIAPRSAGRWSLPRREPDRPSTCPDSTRSP